MATNHNQALENKWWHRLTKVIIWVLTGFVAVVSIIAFIVMTVDEGFQFAALLLLLSSPIAYLLLCILYRKIILYIVLGKDTNPKKKLLNVNFKSTLPWIRNRKWLLTTGALALLVFSFVGYKMFQKNTIRDLRFQLYEVNLEFANATKPFEYLEIISESDYMLRAKGDSITSAKQSRLRWSKYNLDDIAEKCAKIKRCDENMGAQIKEMQHAFEAVNEYYDDLGTGKDSDELLYVRDQAFEISRAVRMKYLMQPDPNIPNFSHDQVKSLVDAQWNLYFVDWIKTKELCDIATDYAKGMDMYSNTCLDDLFYNMFTFNFTEDETETNWGLMTVCDMEKNYLKTPSCSLTLAKTNTAREIYGNYLSTHKNPYYSVSRFPEE